MYDHRFYKCCSDNQQHINKNQLLIPNLIHFAIKNNLPGISHITHFQKFVITYDSLYKCIYSAVQHESTHAICWIEYLFYRYKINELRCLRLTRGFLTYKSVNDYINSNLINNIFEGDDCAEKFDIFFYYFCEYKMIKILVENLELFDEYKYIYLIDIITKDYTIWSCSFLDKFLYQYLTKIKSNKHTIMIITFALKYKK